MKTNTLSVVILSLTASLANGQTSYLMITHATPAAVQRGKTTEVVVEGKMNFLGVSKALFEGAGITTEIMPTPAPQVKPPQKPEVNAAKLKVTVAPDAALGVREFRLASNLGISSIGQLVIVDEPVIVDTAVNNTPDKSVPIAAPCVVSGRIEAIEDVDYFKFQGQAGQVLTFEVHCARLQDKIHDLQKHADPMISLFDAEGREVGANDDSFFADSYLSYTVTKPGEFYLQVRDSKYDGDPRWVYSLLVTNKPYVANLFPMAGNPGKPIEVEPVGSAKLRQPRVTVQVPSEPGLHEVQLDIGGVKTNPAAFIVSPLPQVIEQEPNDAPEQVTRIPIPCGVNGRIGVKRDLDHFVFTAAKGKMIRFEVKSRRFGTPLRSSLDSVLDVMSIPAVAAKDGTKTPTILANNDDAFGKDAALVFTPPADGDYILRVRDLNSKGGETAVYYLEADWARPDFALKCDPDKAMIGPGSSTAWYFQLTRANGFIGPVKVEVKGLPKGVTASPLTIPPAMTQGMLVLTAAADAPRDIANVQIIGTATIPAGDGKDPQAMETIQRQAVSTEEIYNPGGGRARFDVKLQSVAVTDTSDIVKVNVTPPTITLKPGQEVKIDVTIQRRPDYDKAVSIDVMLQHLGSVFGNPLPPGVTIVDGKCKTLLGTGNTGHITLKAADNAAPIENVPISVLAHVSINFVVKVSYSSPVIMVSVVPGSK